MPSGHASHKGSSNKPNTNTTGEVNSAADETLDPTELLAEGPDALRAAEAPENTAATQRPESEERKVSDRAS